MQIGIPESVKCLPRPTPVKPTVVADATTTRDEDEDVVAVAKRDISPEHDFGHEFVVDARSIRGPIPARLASSLAVPPRSFAASQRGRDEGTPVRRDPKSPGYKFRKDVVHSRVASR